MKIYRIVLPFLFIIISQFFTFCSTSNTMSKPDKGGAYIDDEGVLRWKNTKEEIMAFGVNYTVPFAHAYRMAKRLGISPKDAIRQDVYHFARLDFDLYRVHVWDTEISDSVGNLIENEHLELFDFMVHEMKQRNMKFVITPLAFWGNGWPEPDEKTPGFSYKYGKDVCLTNADAIAAQANYLKQFLEHVNPYTNIAYKNEKDIIAFEISNEPHHNGTKNEVKEYINTMVRAMRSSGTSTPIFYNFSHSIHLVDAYLESDVQGGTFQWYPTGLVSKHQLKGNYLPYVDKYEIPFKNHTKFQNKAKIVYEFDAADVSGNYMYPAMARSFRTANLQIACQFAYDAMFLAPYNTNYGTHFMNLAYAPQKAISLKIASAIFHEMPRGKDYGSYPENTCFGNVVIDEEKDLVVYNDTTRFFYTNSNHIKPKNANFLDEVCGYGSSEIVNYSGTGAYFLDKLENGVWRLEIMPDAYWLEDPYTPTSPHKQVAAVAYRKHSMKIELPDLGNEFSYKSINKGNVNYGTAKETALDVEPGVYLLTKQGVKSTLKYTDTYKNIRIDEFVAPPANLKSIIVQNKTQQVATENQSDYHIAFNVISAQAVQDVEVNLSGEFGNKILKANAISANLYAVKLPQELTLGGCVNYTIDIKIGDSWYSYPSGMNAKRFDWDNSSTNTYGIQFVNHSLPVCLWKASDDWKNTIQQWHPGIRLKPDSKSGSVDLLYTFNESTKNPWDHQTYQAGDIKNTFKFYLGDKINGQLSGAIQKRNLIVNANKVEGEVTLDLVLIDQQANAFGTRIHLKGGHQQYSIQLKNLHKTKMQLIPSSFPNFQPKFFQSKATEPIQLKNLEWLQVSVIETESQKNEFSIHSVCLQ